MGSAEGRDGEGRGEEAGLSIRRNQPLVPLHLGRSLDISHLNCLKKAFFYIYYLCVCMQNAYESVCCSSQVEDRGPLPGVSVLLPRCPRMMVVVSSYVGAGD